MPGAEIVDHGQARVRKFSLQREGEIGADEAGATGNEEVGRGLCHVCGNCSGARPAAQFLSFRPRWRNGASGSSDLDEDAARVAASESGDERVQSLTISVVKRFVRSEISRDVSPPRRG